VSDVVVRGEVPEQIQKSLLLWVGCIAGALRDQDYLNKLSAAGFESASIEPTRIYQIEDARAFLTGQGMDVDAIAPLVEGKFMSAFVRANKPATAANQSAVLNVMKCCG
jgi:arsenite methyltransferase